MKLKKRILLVSFSLFFMVNLVLPVAGARWYYLESNGYKYEGNPLTLLNYSIGDCYCSSYGRSNVIGYGFWQKIELTFNGLIPPDKVTLTTSGSGLSTKSATVFEDGIGVFTKPSFENLGISYIKINMPGGNIVEYVIQTVTVALVSAINTVLGTFLGLFYVFGGQGKIIIELSQNATPTVANSVQYNARTQVWGYLYSDVTSSPWAMRILDDF